MAFAAATAKEVNALPAYWIFLDVIHLGLESEEEFDHLVERYCPSEVSIADED